MSFQIQKLGTHIKSRCRVTSAGLKGKASLWLATTCSLIFSGKCPQCQILNSQQSYSLEETSIFRPKLLWLPGCLVFSLGNFWHNNPLFGKTCAKLWMHVNRSRSMHKIWSDLPEGLPAHKPRLLRCVRDSSSRIFNGPRSLLTRRCRLLLPTSFAWPCSSTHPVMHSWKRALVITTYKKK